MLRLKASRPGVADLGGCDNGANKASTITGERHTTGFRSLRQPGALIALAIGNLPELDRSFCNAVAWAPALTAHEARRLSGIVSRCCREIGL